MNFYISITLYEDEFLYFETEPSTNAAHDRFQPTKVAKRKSYQFQLESFVDGKVARHAKGFVSKDKHAKTAYTHNICDIRACKQQLILPIILR